MEPRIKTRHPAAVVALSLVTLGIYQYVWYYRVNREMRDFGAAHGDRKLAESKPGRSLWALITGQFLVIPTVVSLVRAGDRIERCELLAGVPARSGDAIGLLAGLWGCCLAAVWLAPPIESAVALVASLVARYWAVVLVQRRLNAAWRDELERRSVASERELAVATA